MPYALQVNSCGDNHMLWYLFKSKDSQHKAWLWVIAEESLMELHKSQKAMNIATKIILELRTYLRFIQHYT
jgi:hypothetical protein